MNSGAKRVSAWQIPAAMFIEVANVSLTKLPADTRQKQRRELHVAVGDKSEEFISGYELGLQTARTLLQAMPSAIRAGVTL